MNLFDFSLKLNGFPIKLAEKHLMVVQNLKADAFKAYVAEKKTDIVAYHMANNPFYQDFVKNINPESWSQIPIITKQDLQQPLAKRLSRNYSKNQVYINKTSGASGEPFIFAKDYFCHALTWAVIKNRFSWYGLNFNNSKQARFYGIPLNTKDYYKERLKDVLSNRYRFPVFNLSAAALEAYLEKFKSTAFQYINGYTSTIVQFAKYLEQKNLVLKIICPTLKVCIVTSEMLFDSDKKLMEKQFGVPVVNEYGASELDIIAFENTQNQWQITSETLFVEIVDEQNKIVPLGQEGRIVITSLYNKAHPFIRYDIGDIGSLTENSTLQKPILKKLTGRCTDFAMLPSGKIAPGLTFYYITKQIIENEGLVREFTIQQLEPNTFKITYVSASSLTHAKQQEVITEMTRYLEPNLTFIFERTTNLKRSKSGKLKQFSSVVKQP
ncbi:phenylacetate--CoA ligase family protein [Bizionia sediminis]|uniref:Phenylacetate--CoA ligase family protein n=1 Tax=Bizionia sediminis TaxID=1737064 RepID=A0ABW5KRQ9_9FLAO